MESVKQENRFNRKKLNHMAGEILAFIGTLDPMWANRLEIVQTDRHLDNIQTLGSLVVRPLDAGEHTVVSSHPFFAGDYTPTSQTTKCPVCEQDFQPGHPGQPVCSNDCALIFYKKAV